VKKRYKVLLGVIAALLLLGSVVAAFAWGPRWNSRPLPSVYESVPCYPGAVDLNLSEDQIEQLQDLRLEHQKEMLEMRNTLQTKRLELQTQLLSEKPDRVKINSLVEEMGELWTDMQKKAIDYQIRMREILTPEQWDKLHSYRSFGGRGQQGNWGLLP